MSDESTHLKEETARRLTKSVWTPYYFMLTYFLWFIATIFYLGKKLLRAGHVFLSKSRIYHGYWPQIVPIFQCTVINSLSLQRHKTVSVTIFTRHPALSPIFTFSQTSHCQLVTFNQSQRKFSMNTTTLSKYTDNQHDIVQSTMQIKRHAMFNYKWERQQAIFSKGSYVLDARDEFFDNENICL